MPREIIRFQCIHCNKKVYASKYKIRDHEKICFFNPDVKSCITCNNMRACDYCDTGSWCSAYDKEVLVKGSPINNCASWEEKQCECGYEDC